MLISVLPDLGTGMIVKKDKAERIPSEPKEKVPPNALKVGAVLLGRSPDGVSMPMTVREIKDKSVVFDLNHPMAGKTLVFDVKVVDVKPAPPIPESGSLLPPPTKPDQS